MTALLCAAAVGTGLLLMWSAWSAPQPVAPVASLRRSRQYERVREQLTLAGFREQGVGAVVAASMLSALVVGGVVLVATAVPALTLLGGAVGLYAPWMFVRHRAVVHLRARREAWPDAVDHVASAVRAGLSIPEALRQLAHHGPEVLREDFAAFARHDAAHGRFDVSLDVLKSSLADPAADRLIESLRLARNVGGSDVGRLLRTLSSFLREDAATRTELAAKQSWTVSAARLALAAPWLALVVVGFRSGGLDAYRSSTGVAVLVVGGIVSWIAYLAMRAIGRLPTEERVMR
ncbi:type II secretion system protein F [Dermacoccus sp. PE3]|uniref:type II secretion system F family protein n=1 Tax=Dermacoccus sp. PE3 TaxID=1641401 RepID=UPI00064275A7|nr:type II secretion system F family protein [Dermacoccus sp. PE3]KLO62614.1 type II secretion system protein F [Dermacoccus sp. PE3]